MRKSKHSTLGRFINYITNTLCLNWVVLAFERTPGCVYVVREGRGGGRRRARSNLREQGNPSIPTSLAKTLPIAKF